MTQPQMTTETTPPTEDFAALLDELFRQSERIEGSVITGTIIAIDNDEAVVDVGLKAEGRVPLKEFSTPGHPAEVQVGDRVEVYVERFENRNGEASLSRDKARREESWNKLEQAFKDNAKVQGMIFGRVKGGFAVDLGGAVAFLPGSQVDIRPVRDVSPLLNKDEPFQILKMDRRRGNIVVSRRAVLEESRAEQRNELLATLKEGQVLSGVVKNITDYGAFVDLGGLDGLLHVTDISWRRVNHPSEVLSVGQTVEVQVIRFNRETQRISLGMKQLEADPWEGVELKYPVGAKFTGRVTNITDYGAFVELEPGVEGPGPRLGDELDQEERSSRQDRLDQSGGRGDGARGRSGQAAHLARPQAVPGQSVGAVPGAASGRRHGRGRNPQHHRVRPVRRSRQRHRRHGPPVRHQLGQAGRRGGGAVQEGRRGPGGGARRRCRQGAASRSASNSSPRIRSRRRSAG